MEGLSKKEEQNLIEKALEAREKAYCPYSGFAVGAALMTQEGKIYTGCNVENSSFGATNCAERTAIFKAVSEGERFFRGIAITGRPQNENAEEFFSDYAYPCGVCRQVMSEFGGEDFQILVARTKEDYRCFTLKELLPMAFGTK